MVENYVFPLTYSFKGFCFLEQLRNWYSLIIFINGHAPTYNPVWDRKLTRKCCWTIANAKILSFNYRQAGITTNIENDIFRFEFYSFF